MPSFETHASAIGGDTLDWEAEWRRSPLPEEEKDQWKAAIKHISVTPRLAERLSQHGWRPEQLARSMEDPMYLIDLSREYSRGPDAKSAFLVLVDVVGRIHDAHLGLALQLRQEAMVALSAPTTGEQGWTFDRIGALIGLTKQRARAIVRSKPGGYRDA